MRVEMSVESESNRSESSPSVSANASHSLNGANGPLFTGEICDAHRLVAMLKAIHMKKTTVMAVTEYGLKLTCQEEGKCLQATSFVERSLFTRYDRVGVDDEPTAVCFALNDLLNAIDIFTTPERARHTSLSSATLRITCGGSDEPVVLSVSDDTTATTAEIRPLSLEQLIVFNVDFVNKIIINADTIMDFWRCADMSSDWIEMSVDERVLRFSTRSECGVANYKVAKGSESVEFYQCSAVVDNKYRMALMRQTLKALLNASKLSIRTTAEGVLSLQFMIKLDDTHENFVEYYILPLVESVP